MLPEIRTSRLVLRSLEDADIPALFALFSDAEITRYWSSPQMQALGEARALLEHIREGYARRSLFQWGIAELAGGAIIGTCTLAHVDESNRRAEIGFALARRLWGKGLVNEAVTALLEHSFETLDFHRMEADVHPANSASLRVLERLGFKREGLLRERWLVGGEAADSVILGLLREEWRRSRS